MAQRVGRGIALLFHDHGTRRGEWSVARPDLHYPRKDPVPIVQEAGWAPGPVWIGAENLALLGFDPRTFQPVARSLYRLRYPAHSDLDVAILSLCVCVERSLATPRCRAPPSARG